MRLMCVQDTKNIANFSSVTKGKIYTGQIGRHSNNPNYIFFICYDDKNKWSEYKASCFAPISEEINTPLVLKEKDMDILHESCLQVDMLNV